MRMSLYTQGDLRVNSHYGYGKSFIKIQESFRNFTYNGERLRVDWNSPRSKIQMYYGPDPVEWAFNKNQYRIHMSQHESTMIVPHKVNAYQNDCEEVWTANYWGAQSMINSGVNKDKIFVYEHALDPYEYKPFLRGKNNKIRFLHINSDSPRKRSDLVEKSFDKLYEKNKDIELTLKYSFAPHKGKDWKNKDVLESKGDWIRPGVRHIFETLSLDEMISLINFHDVLVYPSEGEGFGMIPLEVLATGMPVISTHEWCSYSKFLLDGKIESEIKESTTNWGYPKLGNAVIANPDSVVERMQYFIDNIDTLSNKFYNQVEDIKNEYTWENKTNKFLNDFINRVGVDMFKKNEEAK
jgi:glycosyltransferase involved in cell wall biosynthesis